MSHRHSTNALHDDSQSTQSVDPGNGSGAETVNDSDSSYVTDPEPSDSFTHYLFLKTDFSLSRLSRKLIKKLNDIDLNDENDNDECYESELEEPRRHSTHQHSKDAESNLERKRSMSHEDITTHSKQYHRLNQRMSCKKHLRGHDKSFRDKHEYTDWLDDHHHRYDKCNRVTKIVRIDINEIDEIEGDIKGVKYLEDLFSENNINKFYSFNKGKLSNKSFYLATNGTLSTGSLNSEMSEKTFQRESNEKKKHRNKRRNKKKKSRSRDHHQASHHHHHHQKQNHHHHHHNHHHNHHQTHNNHFVSPKEEIKQKKKKHGLLRTATMNMSRILKNNKRDSEMSMISLETEYSGDLRSYHTKKHEIKDGDLHLFLSSGRMNKRRNAICHKIDTLYREGELHTYMENLLRQDYIETFLL